MGARVNICICYLWLKVKKNFKIAAESKTRPPDVNELLDNNETLDEPIRSVVQAWNPDGIPELISGHFRVLVDFGDKGVRFRRKQGKRGGGDRLKTAIA